MRRVLVGFVVAMAALFGGAASAHAQIIVLPPPPISLPPLPDITGILGLPSLQGNGQASANAESTDRRLGLTAASDPIEDQVFPVVLGFARPETAQAPPVQRLIITSKSNDAGNATCGPSKKNDPGDVRLDVPTPADFVRNVLNGILIRDPGKYLLCGYLQDGEDDAQAVLQVSNAITVRSPRGTLNLGAPGSVATGQTFQLTATGTDEIPRQAVVTLRPTAAGGPATCGASARDERQFGADVVSGVINPGSDPTTLSATVPAQTVPGRALLCGYIGEGLDDPSPEVTASAAVNVVGPSQCAIGQASLAQTYAQAQSALAASTLRGMELSSAKARLTLAQQRLRRTKGKTARRLANGRLKGAQALVTEQTALLAGVQGLTTARQAAFAAQQAATATLCASGA